MRKTLLSLFALTLCACEATYEFQPVTLSEAREPKVRPQENGQYVRAVYADLINRGPQVYDFAIQDENGAEYYRFPVDEAAFLDLILEDIGDPTPVRALIAAGLTASSEARLPAKATVKDERAFIAEQFRRLLGREPSVYELHSFAEEWRRDPAVGPATVVRALCASREYQSF